MEQCKKFINMLQFSSIISIYLFYVNLRLNVNKNQLLPKSRVPDGMPYRLPNKVKDVKFENVVRNIKYTTYLNMEEL